MLQIINKKRTIRSFTTCVLLSLRRLTDSRLPLMCTISSYLTYPTEYGTNTLCSALPAIANSPLTSLKFKNMYNHIHRHSRRRCPLNIWTLLLSSAGICVHININ